MIIDTLLVPKSREQQKVNIIRAFLLISLKVKV